MQSSIIPSSWGRRQAGEHPVDAGRTQWLRFTTAQDAARWIKSLPLTHPAAGYDALLAQLQALAAARVAPLERLAIAEVLREHVAYIESDLVHRYAGKAQPLEKREAEAATQAIALWYALGEQYTACIKALLDGDPGLAAAHATLLHRDLFVSKELVHVHGLAHRIVPPALWQELHATYGLVEALGCASTALSDPLLPHGVGIACYSMYSHALLLGLADLYALSTKQIELTDRWLQRWARKVQPHTGPREAEGPLILVDLKASACATRPATLPQVPSDSLRYAYSGKLGSSIHGRLRRLKSGADPQELQLGSDCSCEQATTLLAHLEGCWCLPPRAAAAVEAPGLVELCTGGLYGAFFRIGGRSFERSDPQRPYQSHGTRPIASFDALTDFDRGKDYAEREWPWERWHGSVGLRDAKLSRTDIARYRWTLEQVAIVRGADSHRVGYTTRVANAGDGTIDIAMTLWAGVPRAMTLRPLATAMSEQPAPIPAVSLSITTAETPCLLLPPRAFVAGRALRYVDAGAERRLRLVRLLQRGADFERVSFETLQ